MTTSPWRGLLGGLLVGLIAGCAHGRGNAPAQTETGASSVTSDDIQRAPGESIEELLMSRYPGVTVTRTSDGGIAIRIRGATSLGGGGEPLYVLDGTPIQPGPNGSLAGVNAYDIESIQVLKDAISMTMYGGRAANGVIVIKTKRPPRR
jgi:TonB-dependent SusC/RagA subfamily outer membrane receptor